MKMPRASSFLSAPGRLQKSCAGSSVLQKSSGTVWNNGAIDFFLSLIELLGKGGKKKERKKNRLILRGTSGFWF